MNEPELCGEGQRRNQQITQNMIHLFVGLAFAYSNRHQENGKLKICVDYQELNGMTKSNPFPLPFTKEILEIVARHEFLSLLNMFSGYNQVRIAP